MITEICEEKKRYLPLLLLADEQEDMIDRYLKRGRMFALVEDDLKAICVTTEEGDGILEIKNLAVVPQYQRNGYGRRMIEEISALFRNSFSILQVGTGESPLTLPFYEACGFQKTGVIKNFFVEHYDHPIIEGGVQLVDMVVLQKSM